MPSRRSFLHALVGSVAADRLLRAPSKGQSIQIQQRINRVALVKRHNPIVTTIDPLSPLSVGNGQFAFTADVTGLQTLYETYEKAMPLCTMSQWGWHTQPAREGLDPKRLRLTPYDTYGRQVGYQTSSEGQTELYQWLRENPHRLHLGRIGFCRPAGQTIIELEDLRDIRQELDLWSGTLKSYFKLDGHSITVLTAVDPRLDLVAVSIESTLINEGRLAVRIDFPYGSPLMQAADWTKPGRHKTEIVTNSNHRTDIRRTLDADQYFVSFAWREPARLAVIDRHSVRLLPSAGMSKIGFVAAFSVKPTKATLPDYQDTFSACSNHWQRFWNDGGTVELAQSKDTRASELERRVVLSQYLTAIQCSGSAPPQETGLTVNSWYGKFHLEMHWWHAAQFALWNRLPLFENSLNWYQSILPAARALARSQGYQGARWPKMVGPEGRDSPSPIGPLLIWQQPHPIFYAEVCYQSRPGKRTLEQYRSIVFESAAFMASYAHWQDSRGRYVLGPPVIPAQENHPPRETWNPTFELAYWRYGLKTAQRWRERVGLKRDPTWDQVIKGLSALPVNEGVYIAHENCPQTFKERNYDHPSMLGAYGVLPGDGVERETMRRTLLKTIKEWKWEQTWGWDYPLAAMTAARLGERSIAVDALLMATPKNSYLKNGHNWQRQNLPCYLPGNGGLLYAIAMMAAGWQNAPDEHAPGFPQDGSWTVRWENLASQLLKKL